MSEAALTVAPTRPAVDELARQLRHYRTQRKTWMYWYYGTKLTILVLGALIPILTTLPAWPWVIAVVGGSITVVEGASQVWHFHERYLAGRALFRGLDKERILFESEAAPYTDAAGRDRELALRLATLFDTYEAQVVSSLQVPDPKAT